ncbi:hypothetical protein [Tardiphaga sp. 367_B4_N1_1]|uniref:hypothetical protein n=1 Tax=Tardiphaga sp. 367_B4_N1_1 TaxID=3240777 RepID=UPI003F1F734D
MSNRRRLCELSMVPELAAEVATQIDGAVAAKAQVTALSAMTVTATTGTLPTPNGAVTIANAATPTVAELLEFCMELKAKLDAAVTALKA